ncbi:MAG TPA: hypothetical protein VK016_06975 [Arenimonas sp.]|nr:hypothetical protein [Arenimonas sp.]
MYRFPLVLCLVLLAAPALAEEGAAGPAHKQACPQAEQASHEDTGKDAGKGSARPGETAPVRPRSSSGSGRSGMRWHSLLPGMMR